MKKPTALLLPLLLLLTTCSGSGQPDNAATLPTPEGEMLVEAGLRAEDDAFAEGVKLSELSERRREAHELLRSGALEWRDL